MNLFNKTPEIIKFGMWGPPGSGKTTYITMLQYAECDGWTIKPRGKETQDLYIDYSEALRDRKEFVPPTIVDKIWYLSFDFDGPKGFLNNKSFRVVLPEASGEYYERPDIHPELLNEMYRYQGVVWLIDPERIDHPDAESRSYRRMIQEWIFRLHELQGGGMLKHRMAFCLTKMDLPEYSKFIDIPRDFCLDKLGADVEKLLGDYCISENVEFFATSSIGFLPGQKERISCRDPNDSTKLLFASTPENIFLPFNWLFNRF